ncbi:MAG: hypothetical protein DDT23_00828 [candidate division WS2 bacterium]|nr:hypothetical protein [Candidatus Lithacetigena glycinireducens]
MTKKNIIIFIFIVGLVFVFWSSVLLQDYFKQAILFLEDFSSHYPWQSVFIFISLAAISTMLAFFSSIWLVPPAIVLWGNSLTVLFLLLGWLIGAFFSYLIGQYGGYPLVQKLTSSKQILYYERLFSERLGFWVIFLFRFTLPSEIPGYVLGIIRYPFAKYFLITFLAELPYAIYAVYAINAIIEKNPTALAVATAVWIVAALILTYLYRKKVINKKYV